MNAFRSNLVLYSTTMDCAIVMPKIEHVMDCAIVMLKIEYVMDCAIVMLKIEHVLDCTIMYAITFSRSVVMDCTMRM